VFPDKSLDRELALWLGGGTLAIAHYKLAVHDWPIEQETLGDSDVLAIRGLLRGWLRREAPLEATQALAINRTNVLAWLVTVWNHGVIDPEDARATAAAHPKDWRAWWLLWSATQPGAEAQSAHDQLCNLVKGTLSSKIESCEPGG
jgi:hypothetical protein